MQHVKDNIEEQYWQAFMERDSRANGTFFVAVRSTGIYCKPSCPSKRPKRENVMFFTVPEAARSEERRVGKEWRCRGARTQSYESVIERIVNVKVREFLR